MAVVYCIYSGTLVDAKGRFSVFSVGGVALCACQFARDLLTIALKYHSCTVSHAVEVTQKIRQ